MKTIHLWDLPTRAFHWLLVAAIGAAWFTGEQAGSWMVWHGRIGILIIGLISFRLAWGVVGSTYARFANFVRGPAVIADYLRGRWHGHGHNPLGALSVLGLLGLISLQLGTGLFATSDDSGFNGFLQSLVGSGLSERLTGLHHLGFDILLVLIGLHFAAIVFYTHFKKDNLLKPMLTGKKQVERGEDARGGRWPALVLALLIAFGAMWAASGAWLPPPPPPPASSW